MQISEKILPYIQGKEFGGLVPFKVEQKGKLQNRMDFVEQMVKQKSVIHVGCLDHLPMIKDKIKHDQWFHLRLTNVASECLGLDVNQEGIELVKSEMNIPNIYYGNIDSDQKISSIASRYWDYIVFGEILEHVDNPVSFLQKVASNYHSSIGKIIITVPNAFRAGNIQSLVKNTELINSDHRYWFSPYTIYKVVHQAGLKVERMEMCKYSNTLGVKGKIKDFVLQRYPLIAENIVVICHI
jgi:2-polyprenyl-3-methyl-5-hydroxy-6-metoxy-1,4-benzoquinol methylase